MLKYYIKAHEALHRLRTDMGGTVSLEYVVVGAAVTVVVAGVFMGTGGNSLTGALDKGFSNIVAAMPAS